MMRSALFLVVPVALTGLALAQVGHHVDLGPPAVEAVQGLYGGIFNDAQGQHKIEARIVAVAKDRYKVLIREAQADGKVVKGELAATGEKDLTLAVRGQFKGVEWAGRLSLESAVKGTVGRDGSFEFKPIARKSPTLGAEPPAGAVVLLDGKSFDEVTNQPNKDGAKQEWKLTEGGAIQVPKGGMNSKRQFSGSIKYHIEFYLPLMPAAEGQGRANSGCYLPNGEEIQVLDSFGMTTYTGGGCGGLYRYKDPDAFDEFSLASLPPLQWQTYDIEYRVQMKDGKPAGKPRVTVVHNGIKIHDRFELQKDARVGGLHFQDHGNAVQYRNIWVMPLADAK
jgi:hypothetical protein